MKQVNTNRLIEKNKRYKIMVISVDVDDNGKEIKESLNVRECSKLVPKGLPIQFTIENNLEHHLQHMANSCIKELIHIDNEIEERHR